MLLLKAALLLLVGFCNIIFAALVLSKNTKKLSNIGFFIASIGMAGWVIGVAVFLLSNDASIAISVARLYYVFPLIIGFGLILFSLSFPDYKRVNMPVVISIFVSMVILSGLILFHDGFLLHDIVYHDWGKEVTFNRSHYLIYSLYLIITYGGTLCITYLKSHREKGIYAAQASLFFWGWLITVSIGAGFNLFLPWFGNYELIWIGPYCTAIFMVAIAYSIVRHHLFNIRSVVARSIAYLLSIAVLTVIYTSLIYSVTLLIDDEAENTGRITDIVNAVLLAVMVPLYAPLKRFFDKATSRYFYRDGYNSQHLINSLNEILVKTSNTNAVLRKASDLLEKTMKVETIGFVLLPTMKHGAPKFIAANDKFSNAENMSLLNDLETTRTGTIYVEDDDSSSHIKIKQQLDERKWALSFRLVTNSQRVGYILIGHKRSGSSYSDQDKSVLNIISDELALAIQNNLRYEEISRFNETLQRNIDDATRDLRRANEKLKALDETKDEFISMASHQLRTPLTSVKGYLSMVLEGDVGKVSEQQEKLLKQAFFSSQRMVYLISDLLNVSRLRTGKFIIEAVETDLPEIIEGEISQLYETAEAKGLQLKFNKPKDFPRVLLDETKIRQVIMNFVDNAIYYSPNGGDIVIELDDKLNTIEFRVNDTGIGVPKNQQHELFGKFYRAENARRARPDGTGLGLFMAKKVVIAQGGAIIFKSIEGKGSTFGFTFPKSKLLAPKKTSAE